MKKSILITLILFVGQDFSRAQGFQKLFWPNLTQYDHLGFYVDADRMLMGGSYYNGSTSRTTGILMKADTLGALIANSSWILDEVNGWGPRSFRRIDANNTLISGGSSFSIGSAFLAKVNHTTGVVGFSKYYSANAFGKQFQANDAIAFSNGELGLVGNLDENIGSPSCPFAMGTCQAPAAYGYLKNDFGSLSYGRGDDVCLIRTDANGDSLWVKKYHLAYDLNGTFNYCPFTAWLADSARTESPTRIIEVGTDIFITGFTIDYYRTCMAMTRDPQAFLMKLNAAGVVQWCKTFYIGATPLDYGVDIAAVTSDASNDIIMLTRSDNSGNVELCRIQNGTGNIVWARSFDFGYSERGWGIKQTADGRFVISITASGTLLGSYDLLLLKIDRNGNYMDIKGMGTANMDGTDSWAWYGPNADVFSQGSYAIAGVTNYSGGNTGSSYVCKVINQTFSTACPAKEFSVSTISMTDRNAGGIDQLRSRTPLVYQTRGGTGKGNLALTSVLFAPTATTACLLPVELLSFSGVKSTRREVLLNWITASEQNNSHFILERSTDKQEFTPITMVTGAGNSNTTLSYEFIDRELPGNEATYFYRLRQFDFDGTYTLSHIISIEPDDEELFSLFVNENTGAVEFNFNLYRSQSISVELHDISGKVLFSRSVRADKGFNKIITPVPNISNGFYLCTLSTETKKISRKISYHPSNH